MQQARTTTLSTTPRSLPPFITSTSSHSVPQLPATSSSPSFNSNSKLGSSTLPPFSNKSNGTGIHPLLSEGSDMLESEMSEQDLSFETDDGNSHHQTQDLEGRLAPSGLKSGSPPTLLARAAEEEERERKERVQKVMKRVYLAKLTRTFQNRVAFASFKIQRGWQDARIEVIEPHLEEVARKRKLEAQQDQQGHGQHLQHQEFRNPQPQLHQRQHQPIHYQQQVHDPQAMHSQQLPPHAQYNSQIPPPHQQQASLSHSHSSELQSIPMVYADSSSTSSLNAPRSAKRARGGSLADASMANTSMYDQYPSTHSSFPPLENYAGTFSPHVNGHHQPMASTSTLSNGSINGLPRSNSLPKAQLYSSPMRPQSTNQESSARKKSTTDSNFNSFVNAATALTGLARNPSDDQLLMGTSTSEQIFNGGGGGGGELPVPTSPSGLIHHPSHQQHQHQPRTPPPLHSSLKGKSSMMLENPTADAAELMLFLAASPSPAQNRVASSNNIGGEGLKGRRLFSTGDDYGKYLGAGAGAGGGGAGGGGGGGDYTSHPHPNNDTTSNNSIYDSIGQPPMTPSRERDRTTSFGGGDWGAYLNVSPSPTRGGGGAGRGMGGGGGVGGGQAFADFPMGTTASNSNGGTVAW